ASVGWADPHQKLSVQPAPAGGKVEWAALESLQGCIAEDGANDHTVVRPPRLRGCVESAYGEHGDEASLIGFAIADATLQAVRESSYAVPLMGVDTRGRWTERGLVC